MEEVGQRIACFLVSEFCRVSLSGAKDEAALSFSVRPACQVSHRDW